MDEVEVKILEIDKAAIITKLEKRGAKKIFEGEISGALIDTKDKTIYNRGDLLRVRKVKDKVEVTYKQKVQ